jgi:hypothetical protein
MKMIYRNINKEIKTILDLKSSKIKELKVLRMLKTLQAILAYI